MVSRFRKIPPVCLMVSLVRLLTGSLRYSKNNLHDVVRMEDGQEYNIFRHISAYPLQEGETSIVFIVNFKFARLSHKANMVASMIPMLLITGFPGFITKIYAVNKKNGFWMGMYQWRSKQVLEEYKKSFVFRMMNKRAIDDTIISTEYQNQQLINFIEEIKIH